MKYQTRQIVVEPSSWLEATTTASQTKLEIGGILAGWRHDTGIYISKFVEVPDMRATRATYLRRHAFASERLKSLVETLPEGSPVGYVGEWHTHPENQGPSRTDRNQLKRISKKVKGDIALIVLVYDQNTGQWMPAGMCANSGVVHTAVIRIDNSLAMQIKSV